MSSSERSAIVSAPAMDGSGGTGVGSTTGVGGAGGLAPAVVPVGGGVVGRAIGGLCLQALAATSPRRRRSATTTDDVRRGILSRLRFFASVDIRETIVTSWDGNCCQPW